MSFLRPRVSRPRGRGWGLAASATFAARRDFEMLKLLSTADPSVVAVARQLGASLDVSSAEHCSAGNGAAKRAAPTRGSDVGAASSSTAKPRRRRKLVVSEVQRAKKDANFQASPTRTRLPYIAMRISSVCICVARVVSCALWGVSI